MQAPKTLLSERRHWCNPSSFYWINCGEENETSINFEFRHWIWSVVCYYYCLSSSPRTSKIPALNSLLDLHHGLYCCEEISKRRLLLRTNPLILPVHCKNCHRHMVLYNIWLNMLSRGANIAFIWLEMRPLWRVSLLLSFQANWLIDFEGTLLFLLFQDSSLCLDILQTPCNFRYCAWFEGRSLTRHKIFAIWRDINSSNKSPTVSFAMLSSRVQT